MAEAGTKLSLDQRIQTVRSGFEAFKRGDLKAVGELFTDDAVWHGRGSTKFGGDFKGRDAIMGNMAQFAQTFQDIQLDIHDILANEQHVVALVNSSVKRNGKTYEDHQTFVFHLNNEGKTTETWITSDTELLKKSLED
jgi:ketosteroid isomerase-like protein